MAIYSKSNSKPVGLKVERFDLDPDNYVMVREMAATDILHYQAQFKEDANQFDFACDMIAHSVVDDNGDPIFTDADDVAHNFKVGTSSFYAIQEKVFQMSGLPGKSDPKN